MKMKSRGNKVRKKEEKRKGERERSGEKSDRICR